MKEMAEIEYKQDGTLVVYVKEGKNIDRVLVIGNDHYGGAYYLDD